MAFTYDLATDIGKVRLEIGDETVLGGVKPDGSNFSDEEIQIYLDREGSVMRAAAGLCENLSTRWATVADISVGPRRESLGKVSENFMKRAKDLRDVYGGNVVSGITSIQPVRVDGYSPQEVLDEYDYE